MSVNQQAPWYQTSWVTVIRRDKTTYRGSEYVVNLIPKVKIETIAADDVADKIIFKVCERISTGKIGDGKIFVYDVADVVRIRTGERGETAL